MQDSNLRIHESKSCALPTWRIPNVVSAQGFEPRTHALEGRCSIQLSYAPTLISLERETRFELATSTLARLRSTTELLPLIMFYMVRVEGLEPPRTRRQILSLVRLPIPPHPHINLVEDGGFEPPKS
jgi:hypothetical protein